MAFPKCLPHSELYRNHSLCIESQLILVIHTFCTCTFTYMLKLISNPNACGAFMVICRQVQNSKKLKSPDMHISSWGQKRPRCASLSKLWYYKQVCFLWSIWCHIFHTFVLFVGDFAVYSGPQERCWSAVWHPEHKKAVMGLRRGNSCVKLCSRLS